MPAARRAALPVALAAVAAGALGALTAPAAPAAPPALAVGGTWHTDAVHLDDTVTAVQADGAGPAPALAPTTSSTPVTVTCPSTGGPVAVLKARGAAGETQPYELRLNTYLKASGSLTADGSGTFTRKVGVADGRTVRLTLRLGGVTVVDAAVAVDCAAPDRRGLASDYVIAAKDTSGRTLRWDPCSADGLVHYRVNAAKGGDGALKDAKAAVGRIAADTGLRFAYDGTTDFVPTKSNASSYPAGTELVVAWATAGTGPGQSDWFSPGAIGQGGWRSYGNRIVQGFVLLDASQAAGMKPGFGSGSTRGSVLLHELGHAVGLGHAAHPEQVMYPTVSSTTRSAFGAGDEAGLVAEGASNGCVSFG